MAAYTYTAVTPDGQTQTGVTEGDSPRQIRQFLRAQGLIPVDVVANQIRKKSQLIDFKRKKIAIADLALMTRQIATLIDAGLPVEEALQGVAEQTDKTPIKAEILSLRAKVVEGHSLAQAMHQHPNTFPELYCATVAAGEKTGQLGVILNRLADHSEQQYAMRQKILHALIYPAVMTAVSIAIVSFLMMFVVPKIIGVFTQSGQRLPNVTLALVAISHGLQQYGLYLLGLLAIAGIAWRFMKQKPSVTMRYHRFLLKLPFLSFMIESINTARYARTLGILSAAGVTILDAMQIAAGLVSNIPMRDAITHAAKRVKEGASIHYALKQTRFFSPMSLHMIASGEKSGKLSDMLERAADSQETQVARLIDTGLRLFEPMMILVMGAVVLFIVLAILLPIFQMDQLVG
jgi:general secretion pathway protein F